MLRLIRVLAVTHLVAFLLPVLLFAASFGWFVAEPAVELGPLVFTCSVQIVGDGSEVQGCFWTLR